MNTTAKTATGWKKIDVASYIASSGGGIDPFSMISSDWMIVSAGDAGDWNGMTASWGGLGHLWSRDVALCFVRPTRHTFKYMEGAPLFTLSFFDPSLKGALDYFGSHSGRDGDKAAGAGLTPVVFEEGGISYAEARRVLVCQKLYSQDFDPKRFIDPSIEKNYPAKDYHRMYVGEILSVRVRG